jgi:hypothetical protein
VGDNLLESVITRRSADELKLKKGDKVAAVVEGYRSDDPEGLSAFSTSKAFTIRIHRAGRLSLGTTTLKGPCFGSSAFPFIVSATMI